MRYLLGSLWRCAGTILLVLASATTAQAQGGWTITDLGTLGGGFSNANDINEAGHVVGGSTTANGEQEHAFLWTPFTGMVDLGTLGGPFSAAQGLNDAGQVVGAAATPGPFGSGPSHAFLWNAASGMVDLGTLGGPQSSARAINETGQVVGLSETTVGEEHAFLWTQSGGMVDLGTLGGPNSSASHINDAGQVVGRSDTASGDVRAFMWTPSSGMIDLGTIGGAARSQAEGINEAGEVVGFFNPNEDHAFYWTTADGMIELPTLGGIESRGMAINNAGQITGFAEIANFDEHAVVWNAASNPPTPEEQITSLGTSVQDLVTGGSLKPGQANGLTSPLQNALRSLARGQIGAACSQLYDFQVEVTRKVLDGALAPGEGVALIDAAASIRTALGC